MDPFNDVMLAESGDLDDPEVIEAFQRLIDSGLVWQLQGFFGRTAARLIEEGTCHRKGQ